MMKFIPFGLFQNGSSEVNGIFDSQFLNKSVSWPPIFNGIGIHTVYTIIFIKGSLGEKLPSYEVLKMQ